MSIYNVSRVAVFALGAVGTSGLQLNLESTPATPASTSLDVFIH